MFVLFEIINGIEILFQFYPHLIFLFVKFYPYSFNRYLCILSLFNLVPGPLVNIFFNFK